jgi:putative SOS response-associated peptidase YedK
MCGRYTLSQSAEAIAKSFDISDTQNITSLQPQYNIAPTQAVLVVLQNQDINKRVLQRLRWGLIPSWAKDASMGAKLMNARAETVAEKPSFRAAFKRRRCLVIADGFYEWQHQEGKKEGKKQPFYFQLQDKQPFAFAGLWEHWQPPEAEAEEIASCTILTTNANELMQPIHDRIPVILQSEDYDLWLDVQVQDPEMLKPLLQPFPAEAMTAYPVSTVVNNARNNTPECIVPL